ncbi:MAG: twin-arginine translocase TatA/TatE family subunit [Anaerolineae bacterium]|nr:twin-arginine translocase TatA/TatE family subunit [Anaerolineae bacterium]MDW8170879.1 twin-arginine translocase TatA/TatE family subunit [Anaerolineae bacterium]
MNIFGIGGAELVLILLIALVVAGPKRMIEWAYHLGRWVAKLRQMWSQMMDVVQQEVDAAGLDVKLPKELPTRQSLNQTINQAMKPLTDPLRQTLDEASLSQKPVSAPHTRRSEQLLTGRKLTSGANGAAPSEAAAPPAPSLGSWSNPSVGDSALLDSLSSRFGTWSQLPASTDSEERS